MFAAHAQTRFRTPASLLKKLAAVAILAVASSTLTCIAPAVATQVNTLPDWEIQSSVDPLSGVTDSRLSSVTFANENFYAVGNNDGGNILKSTTDGTDWFLPYESGARNSVNDIAVCGTHGVTVGTGWVYAQDETNPAAPSGSGQNPLPVDDPQGLLNWTSVACGDINGQMTWMAVADNTNNPDPSTKISAITSIDNGQTWTPQTAAPIDWASLAYGNGTFVAVARSGDNDRRAMSNSDGTTWNLWNLEPNNEVFWQSVTFGKDGTGASLFVAVGSGGGSMLIMTSPDGATWTPLQAPSDNAWTTVTYGNGIFIALASSGTHKRMMTSPDGVTWTERFAPVRNWNSVAYGHGVFVAVSLDGGSRQIMKSTYDYETLSCPDGGTYDVTSHGVATNGGNCNDPSFNQTATGVLTLDASVTEVGNAAFWGATISNLSGFANVGRIDDHAFRDNSITTLTLGEHVTSIGDFALDHINVSTLLLPNSLLTVGDYAFAWAAIGTLKIGNSLQTIGQSAFYWDTQLSSLSFPSTLTEIGPNAFNNAMLSSVAFYSPQLTVGVTAFNGSMPCFYNLGNASINLTDTGLTAACEITLSAGPHGSISLAPRVPEQNLPGFLITPDSGYVISAFTADANDAKSVLEVAGDSSFKYLLPLSANSHVLSASFTRGGNPNDWTLQNSNEGVWTGVTYAGGEFIAVGNSTVNGTDYAFSPLNVSADGETWTSPNFEYSTSRYNSVTYCRDHYLLAGKGGPYGSKRDGNGYSDGRFSVTDEQMSYLDNFQGIACGNGTAVAVADGQGPDSLISSKTSLYASWRGRTPAAHLNWTSITYGKGMFVAVASSGTGNRVMTSPDGISWTSRVSAADNNWTSVTYGKGMFVAVASSGTGNRVMTSPDGITWTSRTSAADKHWNSVAYGNNQFVAVSGTTGTSSNVMSSIDGVHWTSIASPDQNWTGVTYGAGKFVAVSSDGGSQQVMTSTGGAVLTVSKSVMESVVNQNSTDTSVVSTNFTSEFLVGTYLKDVDCVGGIWYTTDTIDDGFVLAGSGQMYDPITYTPAFANIGNDFTCSGTTTWVVKVFDPSDPRLSGIDPSNIPFHTPSVSSKTIQLVPASTRTFTCGTGHYDVSATGVASNGATCNSELILDSSVRSIADQAFVGAELSRVEIQAGVTAIGSQAFLNTGTETLLLPDSLVTIGDEAFKGDYISNITFGTGNSSLQTIGDGAFYDLRVDSLIIPNSVISIGNRAFASVSPTTFSLGESVQTIGSEAFNSLQATSLVLPASVTEVSDWAFQAAHLTNLVIKSPSISFGSGVFDAVGSGLACFYNLGNAPLTRGELDTALLYGVNPCQTYEIAASSGLNGSVATTFDVIDNGAEPVYTITPNSGYEIDAVLVDGVDVTNSLVSGPGTAKSFTFDPVTTDRTISVTFKRAAVQAPAPITVGSNPTPSPTPTPTDSGKPTTNPTPTPTPTPGPTSISINVSGFAPGSPLLNTAAKKALRGIASKLNLAKAITITGFTQGPTVLASDYALSKKRAEGVRAFLRSLLRKPISIYVSGKQSLAVGGSVRRVLLTLRY
jgi:outer membrane protein OmpA-like peptidoglycan-associated protein